MQYYAVIDTNVIVSAFLKSNSVPDMVVGYSLKNIIVPLLSQDILKEYREVLSREKFGLDNSIIDDFLNEFSKNSVFIDAQDTGIVLPDMKDIPFFNIVMEKRKTDEAYLVTGNIKHFPREPFIVTPREMLEIIFKDLSD